MPANTKSAPGGWKKDTPTTENPNPTETAQETQSQAQDVPRSAVGSVNEAGEVVNQSGQSIGKITEEKDPKELAGSSVNEAGEIVSEAGDVLGKANIADSGNADDAEENASEYTAEAQDEAKSSGGGWMSKTKGAFNAVGSGIGSLSGRSQKTESEAEDTKDSTTNQTNDAVEGAKDAAGDKAEEGAKAAEGAKDQAGEATKQADDAKQDAADQAQDDAEQTKDQAEDTTKAAKDKNEEVAEEAKDQAEEGAEATDNKAEEAAENTGDKTKEATEDAQVKADEAQDKAEEAEGEAEDQLDFSILDGTTVNKAGNLVDSDGKVLGRLVDGEAKKLQGKKCDGDGDIWNDAGKKVGRAEPLPESERESSNKQFAPFENFPDAVVEADGRVTSDGNQIGTVVEGDAKKLKGSKVDEDGDILDRNGNTVGRAEAWDEPEEVQEEEPDRSTLAGKRVNKAGNVVDQNGSIFGKVVEGNVSSMNGRMCDKDGNIRSESGDILGKAEVLPEGEREGMKEGPFAELEGLTVSKDGKVVTASGDVVGRLTSGDPKKLFGRSVDADGDVVDGNGNVLAKAERWEEPEPEEKKKGPMAGLKVNKEGNVLDEDGNTIGKLTSGDLQVCSGKEIDDDGDVVNSKGNTVGHCTLLEDIPPEPEESEEDKKTREQAEKDRELAQKMGGCIEQSLEKIRPILRMITDKIDTAERTPKEELDEEQLVKEVKPLIEEGGKVLSETNGMIRGMDPDGRIQRNAKHKSGTKDASPEEYHLAEMLKELTGNVTETIDNAKRKIEGMPHAKDELNPLWGLLTEPLGQILAAVGLLLSGVLGLVGRLLSGLGLGGLVDGLLGGLGLDKVLSGLGLGTAYNKLVGKE